MQIANSVRCLLIRPDHWRLLHDAQSTLISRASEELLRLDPGVNHSLPRVATGDVELGGMTIPAGETVIAALPVANRDDAVFAQPEQLDFARPINRHLSFGHGIHYCLGAYLARVELQVGLGALLRRLPSLRLAVRDTELRPFVTQGARGVDPTGVLVICPHGGQVGSRVAARQPSGALHQP